MNGDEELKCKICGAEQGSFFEQCCDNCWINRAVTAELEVQLLKTKKCQPCGHSMRFIYSSNEGTSHCEECAKIADLESAIHVWPFDDAPEEYRRLSTHGGDEDWVVFIPQDVWDKTDGCIPWCEPEYRAGFGWVEEYRVIGGVVRIGAHS